jgi:hypothetical protein
VSAQFWLDLQNRYDLEKLAILMGDTYDSIETLQHVVASPDLPSYSTTNSRSSGGLMDNGKRGSSESTGQSTFHGRGSLQLCSHLNATAGMVRDNMIEAHRRMH